MSALPPLSRDIALAEGGRWAIAEETPVEIGFNGAAWTVMMASPADLEDLAVGLAFTEGLLDSAAPVRAIEVKAWPEGVTADIAVSEDALAEEPRRRALDGRTGCGLCGVERLTDLYRRPETGGSRPAITPEAARRALDGLAAQQPLNAATRSVHAAAWCDPEGRILLVREDVGRHNALDKLAGAMARKGRIGEAGFVVMSSRCSYELVFKAARLGAAGLATISAPTGLALDLAEAYGLTLFARGPQGAAIMFRPRERAA
jgi:FdhD protein